jgi:ribosomal protein S18 acetylase RimI-like enzyme
MTTVEIAIATPNDRDRVIGSLVAAFAKDPLLQYLAPDETTYEPSATAFFGDLFDKRVHKGATWTIGGGASVAIWDPPTSGDDGGSPVHNERLEAEMSADVLSRVRAYDEAVHQALPDEPFWYLGVLGTHPDSTGRRWGHAVMAEGLSRAAEDDLPAVLETSNPANVEMYRRAGWEVVRAVEDPLPTWVMSQLPR